MKHKQAPLFLLPFLAAVLLVSGCTGLDPTALAKSNSMIQQFMSEHPNAQIVVTHFTANQSKYIIDQIRKDCDNPYLDEKEFYRVNITDPDTDFYAIVWIDWETKTVECVFKIGTEGKTVEKPNVGNCTNHAYSKCYNSHIYWFDSCGNVQEKKEYCKQGCSDTACLGDCKSNAEYRCYGDNVYWFDSCGNKQEKKEYCNYGCENGFCKTQRPDKTCEDAGGYCIWPQGYCGNGICEAGEANPTTSDCPTGAECVLKAGTCPQDCLQAQTATSVAGGGQSAATGMIVATEVTSTSTVVSYQCNDGYEIGKYFCKEGGICCTPQTTLPETGFCGSSTQGPCSSDSECAATGCSGQVCQSIKEEKAATTCEYKDCYNAAKYGMVCRCTKDSASVQATAAMIQEASLEGRCMWTKHVSCADDAKVCPDGSTVSRNPNKNCEFDLCPTAAKYYRNAYWQCYDGTEANEGGETSCKSYETWKQYAEEYCKGKCTSTAVTAAANTATKCGVNTFRVWNECSSVTTPCAKEGEQFSLVYKEKYPEHCCTGFTEWESGMDTRKVENGVCVETNLVAGSPIGTCINCGDGICGKYENVCNCPQDCKTETCTDSDGGKNYYVKGAVKASNIPGILYGNDGLYRNATASYAEDTCFGYNGVVNKLEEIYCDGNVAKYYVYDCPNGCSDGACIQQNCSNECPTYGKSECISSTSYKICGNYDSDSCNEWSQTYNCPLYGCSNGVCVDQPQACAANVPCVIKEGHAAVITTNSIAHLIKVVHVTSETAAVLTVDQTTQEVLELNNYSISGLNAYYINAVYFFGAGNIENSVSITAN